MRTRPVLSVLLSLAALPARTSDLPGNLARNGAFDETLASWTVVAGTCVHDTGAGADKAGSAACASALSEHTLQRVRLRQCVPAQAGTYVFSASAQRLSGEDVACTFAIASDLATDCTQLEEVATASLTPDAVRFVRSATQSLNLDAATRAVSLDIACVAASAFVVSIDDVTGLPDRIFKYGFEFLPPVLTAGATLAYTENQAASVIDATVTVSDIDSTSLVGATVQISANYQSGTDTLAFTPVGAITGSFAAASGTLTLSGTDTLANYQTALRSVTFVNNSDNPSTLSRTITWIANDGTAAVPSSAVTSTVTVTAVNDAPVLAGAANLSYTENAVATVISPAITVSDVDGTTLTGATVRISSNFDTGKDVLAFTPVGGITGSFVSDTLTLSGTSSLANYQTALRSVTYFNNSDNPSTATRNVTWRVNDGAAANNLSAAVTRTISVTAVNDAPTGAVPAGSPFAITGNVRRGIAAGTLLVGATDPENNGPLTTQLSGVPSNGATVVVNTNGSFTYNPGAGYEGTATFQFVVCDAAPLCSTPVTVGVNISGMIWFINAAAAAGGTGRLTDPINSIATFNTSNNGTGNNPAANDSIYLYNGTYTGTLTLLAGQKLLGEGMSVSLATASGITPPSGSDALPTTAPSNRPNWTSTGTTLTLGSDNTLRGFNIGNSTTAKISGTSFGTLTVNEMTLSGTGKALGLSTGAFSASSSFDSITTTSSSSQGISLAGISGGALTIGGTTISGATAQGILVGTTQANVSFGNTSVTGGTDSVSLQNNSAGTRTFGTLSTLSGSGAAFLHGAGGGLTSVTGTSNIVNPGAECIFIQNAAASDGVTFANVSCSQSGASGVRLLTNAAPIAFAHLDISPDSGRTALLATDNTGTITTTGGTFNTNGASGMQITGASTASRTPLAMVLDSVNFGGGTSNLSLSNVSGTLTMNSGAMLSASAAAFSVTGSTASISYAGSITNSGSGIVLTNNTGGSIAFTGGMALTTGTNAAFTATGGGTVSATQNNTSIINTLTTTTGTALNVANTSIGASGLTFRSISANGASKGIVLNATGTAAGNGGLAVTGTGTTAGSGGTIQNISARGGEFITTKALSLNYMNFVNANTGDAGGVGVCDDLTTTACNAVLYLSSVSGITLDTINITGTIAEEGINVLNSSDLSMSNTNIGTASAFCGNAVEEGCMKIRELTGTFAITNSLLQFSADQTLELVNTTGNLLFNVNGSSFNDSQTSVGQDGLQVRAQGTSSIIVNVNNSNFLRLRTNGIHVIAINSATADVDITGNSIDPGAAPGTGIGIDLDADNTSTLRFNVQNNPKIYARNGPAMNVFGDTGATIDGRVNNNPDIQVKNNPGGSQVGSAVRANLNKDSRGRLEIKSNTISIASDDSGIDLSAIGKTTANSGGATNTLDATVTGNTVSIGATSAYGVVMVTASNAGDTNASCLNVATNGVTRNPSSIAAFRARVVSVAGYLRMNSFVTNAGVTWNNNGNTPMNDTSFGGSGTFATCTAVLPTNPAITPST